MIQDLIIIGGGPAGITAGVYAARKRMKFLMVTKDIGGQAAWSSDVENYPGYQFITGPDLVAKFQEHMQKYGINLKENEEVVELEKKDKIIYIKTTKESYEAKTVIIAAGKRVKEIGVPGEKEYKNKGVTYCVTCDGPLFAEKDIAVVGGGNSALDAAIQMMNIANKVYLINITDRFIGDSIMQEKIRNNPKVKILHNTRVESITGDKFVKGINVDTHGKKESLDVKGIFIEIGLMPNSWFAKGVDKNEKGEIKVNCANETNVPGIFAAGDVTSVPEKQIVIAAGDGAKAALGTFRYLARLKT
ncbi:MAG: thioredoxin-disulfide reductase [Candidatus Omnitrophica bacterium CG12_big_fil_rev_8_21_14_0_65_42_8]|nr:MAG: thioredoxin-disulfide reductase [Candidatus Omnitrophica bacterium CG12_big_fil_rev_8_21_14_0_65_42_8]